LIVFFLVFAFFFVQGSLKWIYFSYFAFYLRNQAIRQN
jgi:hypothetical protein